MEDKSNNLTGLLMNASTAAEFLGIGRSQFYELHSKDRLGPRPLKLGNRPLWRRLELEAWVTKGCPARDSWQDWGT